MTPDTTVFNTLEIQTVVFQGSKGPCKALVCAPYAVVLPRTVEVTICIILERLVDRPRQLPHVTSTTVHRDPIAAQGTTKTDHGGGRWVAAQKHPQQHLAGETSLLGTTRSPTAVARAPTTSREIATSAVNFGKNQPGQAKVQFQPRSFRAGG